MDGFQRCSPAKPSEVAWSSKRLGIGIMLGVVKSGE